MSIRYGTKLNRRSQFRYKAKEVVGVVGWPQFQFDERNIGTAEVTGVEGDSQEDWSESSGGSVQGAAAIDSDNIYFTDGQGDVVAFSREDGSEVWSTNISAVTDAVAVDSDGVYVVGTDDGLVSLDKGDGSERWTSVSNVEHLTLHDGVVYVGGDQSGGSATKMFAIDASDGSEIWDTNEGGEIVGTPPCVGGGAVIYQSGTEVISVDKGDGSTNWKVEPTFFTFENSAPTYSDGDIFIGDGDGNVLSLDESDGSENWSTDIGGNVTTSPAVKDGWVYVGDFSTSVERLDRDDGSQDWSVNESVETSSPVVVGETLYIGLDSSVKALNVSDGSEDWSFATSSTMNTPAIFEGELYSGERGGNNEMFKLVEN